MLEAPFGSVTPIWPTPVSAFGLTQTPIPQVQAFGITAPALLTAIAVRRGQPLGPTNENEIEDFIYDALELLAGASDVEVRCEGGRVTLTGGVQHKRLKRDIGEIAWTIPGVNDVQNNVAITTRRRSRTQGRENETPTVARKHG